MKLTDQHIAGLYTFTRQHFVEHYDLQTELVDHLAQDIEGIWETQPSLSFEKARDQSFKKFGVFGFMDVVEAKQKELGKVYWKIIFGFAKEWFQLPKIILTALICMLSYTIFSVPFGRSILLGFILVYFVYLVHKAVQFRRAQKQRQQQTSKRWMLEDMLYHSMGGMGFFLPLNTINLLNLTNVEGAFDASILVKILYSLFLTAAIILIYVCTEVIPPKAEKLLQEHYPEYKMVS